MKKRLAIILSILVVAFAAIGVGLYFYFGSTKAVFTKALTKSINEVFEDSPSMLRGIKYDTLKVTTKNNIDVTLDKDKYSGSINGTIAYDKATKKIISDLGIVVNKEKILDFNTLFEGSKLYFKIKDLMNTYYYLDVPVDSTSTTTIEENDIKYVKDLVQKSFFGSLKESDFTKSDEKITLDKEVSTKKISLKLTSKRVNEISKKVLEDIKSDKKAMSIIQKVDKELTGESITNYIKEIDDQAGKLSEKDYLLYTIYIVDNDNIVRHEMSASSEEDSTINNYKLVINTYKNASGFKTREVLFNIMNKPFVKISMVGTSKDSSNITITSDVISGNGTYTKNSNEESISIKLTMQGMDIGTISMKLSKISNTEYSYSLNINAGLLSYKAAITSENKILLNEKVTDIDVKNAKKVETMSQAEMNKIMTTIMMRVAKAFPSLMQ